MPRERTSTTGRAGRLRRRRSPRQPQRRRGGARYGPALAGTAVWIGVAAILLVGCAGTGQVPYTATTGGITYQISVPASFTPQPGFPDASIPSEPGLGFVQTSGSTDHPSTGKMKVTSVADNLATLTPAAIADLAEKAYAHYRDDSQGVLTRHPGRIGLVPAEVVDLSFQIPVDQSRGHTILLFAALKKGAPALLIACDWNSTGTDIASQCIDFANSLTVQPQP